VTGGGITASTAATIKTSGTIQVHSPENIDWTQVRVRPILTINSEDYPLGTYIPSTPVIESDGKNSQAVIHLLDKLCVIDQDRIDGYETATAGTMITDFVAAVIESTGETAATITPTSEVIRADLVHEPGTSKLRIINDTLDAANYFSLWCDWEGNYQVTPYRAPQDRPIAWTFSNKNAVHLPATTREQDIYSIPNKTVIVSQETGDEPALIGIAENTNPASPYSFQARGRWITHTETGVETTGQTALDDYAARRLQELSSATATHTIRHGFLPLNLNDACVIDFRGEPVRAVVTKMDIPMDPTALMTTTLREVVDL
jgi:hypothetical protein